MKWYVIVLFSLLAAVLVVGSMLEGSDPSGKAATAVQTKTEELAKQQDARAAAAATAKTCADKPSAQHLLDMATDSHGDDPPLHVRTDDGMDVRYTFTRVGWSVTNPNVSSNFRDFVLAVASAETCVTDRPARSVEFYKPDGTRAAKVSPWTGVTIY